MNDIIVLSWFYATEGNGLGAPSLLPIESYQRPSGENKTQQVGSNNAYA